MTNSQLLQLIIEELSKSTLSWGNDKELFELICTPLAYGNDIYQQRKEIKKSILKLISNSKFDINKFNALADNIICGDNEEEYRQELFGYVLNQMNSSNEGIKREISKKIKNIPCKKENEKNYKNNFHNWKNGKTDRINRREIKQIIEKNFYFSPSLWDMGEVTIRHAVKEGVAKFVKEHTKDLTQINNLFDDIRKEFNMNDKISEEEKHLLEKFSNMTEKNVMEYIAEHYPLHKHHSQHFLQALIPILYEKGYYDLLLQDVIVSLDIHLQESNQLKKIKARIYSSPKVAEYKKAFDILSTIESTNDEETVDMRTEAISNIRRHYLSNKSVDTRQKRVYIGLLMRYYDDIFKHKDTYHYYPAVNLAYLVVIDFILSDEKIKNKLLFNKINYLYDKCKKSIILDKKSEDVIKRYYASTAELEFLLLKGVGNPIAEIERFLEFKETKIPSQELMRTQRQMQFFVDTVCYFSNNSIIQRVQNAIEIFDDYMESIFLKHRN